MSLISIVIPAFNAAATLPETMESIAAQTWTGWEAIIVEDGSQDDTWAVAQRLAAGDPRIKLVRNPGKGPSDARNHGALKVARGEVIAFCDADDLWESGKLASVALALIFGASDAAFGRVRFFRGKPGNLGASSTVPVEPVTVPMLMGENPVCTMSNLSVRRSVFEALGGFRNDMIHNEDLEWLIRLVGAGYELEGLDSDHVLYRTSPHGLSSDLVAMEMGRAEALRTARALGYAPDARAEAVHLRYLARRALRLDADPRQAMALVAKGLRRSVPAFLFPLKRGLPTAIGALIAPSLPRDLRRSLFSR
jgi:glycosyltransferase involved in cell wall biosynthesis